MAFKIFRKKNYFYIIDTTNLEEKFIGAAKNVTFKRNGSKFSFQNLNEISYIDEYDFADIQDENGNPYTNLNTFVDYLEDNTSNFNTTLGGSSVTSPLELVYTSLQPHLGLNKIAIWLPLSGSTVSAIGMSRSGNGTVSITNPTATNLSTSMFKWVVTSATTANSSADERSPALICWRGNAANLGGFINIRTIQMVEIPSLSRSFFGIHPNTNALSAFTDTKTLTDCVGIGFTQGTDTNWKIYHNDNTGVVTEIDLGANFPIASLTNVLTLTIYCEPNGNSFWVKVVEEESGSSFQAELTTNIPSKDTFFTVRNHINNGGTAQACAHACSRMYLQQKY